MRTSKNRHIHPLTIVANLWRVRYLTVIPVLRGFFFALRGDLGLWLQSAWIDILVFALMLALAIWRWRIVTYRYDEREMILHTGWLVRRKIRVAWNRVTTISVLESFYLRPFGAARLRADTLGGSADSADFSFLVGREQAHRILKRAQGRDNRPRQREYIPRTGSILALALLTSNSFGGILLLSTFVSQSGRLLGNEFPHRLIGTFEEAARVLAFGVPPAAAAIAYMLLAGWVIGFAHAFLRYKNFSVARGAEVLHVGGGLFTERHYCIRYRDINFIDIRQSAATKILRLYSLYISAVGYAKQKDDISCIIPTENHPVFTRNRERLFPAFSPTRRQIAPKLTGLPRYIGLPLVLCASIPIAAVIFSRRYPSWSAFLLFVGLMSLAPALFFFIVRLIDFATAGVARCGKYYTIRYSKGFSLHTVIIPEDKIVAIELRQSLIQQFTENCDIIVSTRAEHRVTHRCRNLNRAGLESLLRMEVYE